MSFVWVNINHLYGPSKYFSLGDDHITGAPYSINQIQGATARSAQTENPSGISSLIVVQITDTEPVKPPFTYSMLLLKPKKIK